MISRQFNFFHELARFLELTRLQKEDIVYIGQDCNLHYWCLIYVERK